MDRVFIRDISLFGKHGVEPEERVTAQEFLVDINAEFDAAPAAASDDLADTVNYVEFVGIAKEAIEQNSFCLIEKIGERIALRILAHPRIQKVKVTVRKPAALSNGLPGVTIVRSKTS